VLGHLSSHFVVIPVWLGCKPEVVNISSSILKEDQQRRKKKQEMKKEGFLLTFSVILILNSTGYSHT
jgi:hypothetical protein